MDEQIPLSHTMTTVVGVLATVICAVCMLANIAILKVIIMNKELLRLNAYKFMVAIGVADVHYSFVYAVHGLCVVARVDLYTTPVPFVATVVGALSVFSYVAYILFTITLAINRFVLTYSSALERRLFSSTGMKIWFGCLGAVVGASFVVCLTPLMGKRFQWQSLGNEYIAELPYSRLLQRLVSFTELYGIILAAFLYALVLILIVKRRNITKLKRRQLGQMEYRILFQSFTITAYSFTVCLIFHYFESPFEDILIWRIFLFFSRVFTGAVNPIVYAFANVTLRRKMCLATTKIKQSASANTANVTSRTAGVGRPTNGFESLEIRADTRPREQSDLRSVPAAHSAPTARVR